VGNGLGTTVKYLRRTRSAATGNGLGATIKTCDAQRAAAQAMAGHHYQVPARRHGHWSGTRIKYLRRTTTGAAGNGLGTTINYLRRTTTGAAGNCLGIKIMCLRSGA
jgi:hypothetical protein